MVAALPCAADASWRPCADVDEMNCYSRSKRRRVRDRRVAIKHAQLQSLSLKSLLLCDGAGDVVTMFDLRAEAPEFYPAVSRVNVDLDSCVFVLGNDDVLLPSRRMLRDACTAEVLPMKLTPMAETCVVVDSGIEADVVCKVHGESASRLIAAGKIKACMGKGRGAHADISSKGRGSKLVDADDGDDLDVVDGVCIGRGSGRGQRRYSGERAGTDVGSDSANATDASSIFCHRGERQADSKGKSKSKCMFLKTRRADMLQLTDAVTERMRRLLRGYVGEPDRHTDDGG